MNITALEPWSVFNLLQRDLQNFPRQRSSLVNGDYESARIADWLPAVDILEEKDRFVLRADLPGVDPQAITVSMDKSVLTLAGERLQEATDESEGMHRIERKSGKFFRRFTLPESADAEAISAKSANGILEVSIPKLAEIQPRRIAVEAA